MKDGKSRWMAARIDEYLKRQQLREHKLAARKVIIRQLRQQLRERNDELCKLGEGQKADDGIAERSKGRSTEDRPDRNGDELEKLREGWKADDGIANIGKKRCVPHGELCWRLVGHVNAVWVPHGNHTQRLKRLKRLDSRRNMIDVRGTCAERWVWRAIEKVYISRARTMMHTERHARSDRRHSEDGNGAYEICI
jgi:hypothetical protein